MTVTSLPLFAIEVPADRARDLDPAWVEGLAAVIAVQGLQHPVRVRPVGEPGDRDGWRLVSGLHRLEAARHLGWSEIAVTVSTAASDDAARLEEVMENLGRHELIALDRCHHLHELKQVWERLHPETKNGGDKNVQKGRATRTQMLRSGGPGKRSVSKGKSGEPVARSDYSGPQVFGFVRATADAIGLSLRSIEQAVRIWERLYPPLRVRLRGTPLADKQTELKALAELDLNLQVKVLDLILDPGHPDIGNVAQALEYLEKGRLPDSVERQYLTASRTLEGLSDTMLDRVLVAHEGRIIAALKRLGCI